MGISIFNMEVFTLQMPKSPAIFLGFDAYARASNPMDQ